MKSTVPFAEVLCLALIAACGGKAASSEAANPRTISVSLSTNKTVRYSKIEFDFKATPIISGENPYDPADVDCRLELTAPSGIKITVPAFFYQPFEYETSANSAWMYPSIAPGFKARFAPKEVGEYRGVGIVSDHIGISRSEQFRFESLPSEDKGFLRVSKNDARYWEFEDGSPFFAIGQNVAFIKDVRQQAEMIRKLGESGGNFARVWACAEDWGLAVEARKSAWGRSWDWNPPFAISPDAEGFHFNQLCLKLSGETGASITLNPCHPVYLKPGREYRFRGRLKGTSGSSVTYLLHGQKQVAVTRQWTFFTNSFIAESQERVLPRMDFKLDGKGTVWLKDLSLREVGQDVELLWEADPNRPQLGVYNQVDADMLDRIVEQAEQSGVYLQLVFLTRDHYMAHLKKNGGRDYEQATDYAKRIARYFAARWGYSTHVAAWEYFNEMDPGLPTEKFYTDLAAQLDSVDVNRHLRVNSTWHSPSKDYRHPQLDTANMHFYLRPPSGEIWKNEVTSILAQWKLNRQALNQRPLFFAEFGITDANWQRAPQLSDDRDFVHLHNALWLTTCLGFGSTVCHWYWDDIHKRNLYPLYTPLSAFIRDIPFNSGKLIPSEMQYPENIQAFGQNSDSFAYIWIWNPQATWWKIAMDKADPEEIKNASISLKGLSAGNYRIEWWDTREGKITSQRTQQIGNEPVRLAIPPFKRDMALKVIKN